LSDDFERVRVIAARSRIARVLSITEATVEAAWRTSAIGRRLKPLMGRLAVTAPPDRVRWCATALAVAAVAHLALRSLMSSTIAPALPAAVALTIAAGSTLVAWQAGAFHRAWPGSRLSRLGPGSWVPQAPSPKPQAPR
jgi:hypothetical protein